MRSDPSLKTSARCLRGQGLSLNEIHQQIGVSKGTLSGWLKEQPLPPDVLREKFRAGQARRKTTNKKPRGDESKLHRMVGELDKATKGRVAEAAVMLRLALHGFVTLTPTSDCARMDIVVDVPGVGLKRIQVRWASARGSYGLPVIGLTCFEGHSAVRRLRPEEFDFIIGYDLFTDTCYVFSESEVRGNGRTITVRPDAAERWDKLKHK